MIAQRQAVFWLGLTGLLFLLLWRLGDVMLPFVIGMVIAYILHPALDWLERHGVTRGLGAFLLIVLFLALILLAGLLIVPVFQLQIGQLIERLPNLFALVRTHIDHLLVDLQRRAHLPADTVRNIQQAASGQGNKALDYVGSLVGGLVTSSIALINLLSLLFVTPVVAFYLLRDWTPLVKRVNQWIPRGQVEVVRAQMREIDRTLSGFVRGQALVCLLLGLFYAVGLTLVGLDFGFIIGILTGLLSFIPYVGSFTGGILSVGFALLQYNSLTGILLVVGVYIIGQAVEGNLLQPLLVGDRVGLHPVWIMFALLAFGGVFGFVGLIVAIPLASVLGVLARFSLGRYLASSLYQPRSLVPPPVPPASSKDLSDRSTAPATGA